MKNYRLQVFGWQIDAAAHSLTTDQVKRIKFIMKENNYEDLNECRFDLEKYGIIEDLNNPNLFRVSHALWNDRLLFRLLDESTERVIDEFKIAEIGHYYDLIGDDDFIDKNYPSESYLAIPGIIEGLDNILLIVDENKGGVIEFRFQSDIQPRPVDFCVLAGDIGTPDGDWDFISKYFFKGQFLEINDYLDNSGKSSSVELYCKDGIFFA